MPLPFRKVGRLSVDELCAAHDNEDAHTEHVTALALRLFDQTRVALGLPANARRLLEAAARLHDVGFSFDPMHHVQAGAEIVLEDGIRGFSQGECEQITQIMVRHSGKANASGVPARLAQLAAFLRIGDGLDYSHAQTARIVSVRRTKRTVFVTVRSDAFPQCLARADQKADLWRVVFPVGIQFVAAPVTKKNREPLVRAEMPIVEAARRLLWIQFKTILVNLDGAVAGETSLPLHDVRIAVRRVRSLLHAFRKYLPATPRKEIEEFVAEISDEIGPVRDIDEWVDFLQFNRVRSMASRSRLFPAYVSHHQQRRQLAYATVRRCLRGRHFASHRLKITRLLREELPRLIKTEPPDLFGKLAAKQVDKVLRNALKHERLRHSRSPKKLHKLRISLRKARYVAEFFAPALGACTKKLAKRLHQLERVLGRIHDVDVGMVHLAREGPLPPRAIAAYLKQQREQNLRKLDKVWRRLTDPALQARVKEELAAVQQSRDQKKKEKM